MPKTHAQNKIEPSPRWVAMVREAYKKLSNKAELYKVDGLSRGTVGRITNETTNELDKVGLDALEIFRVELNKRMKLRIPPPFVPIGSYLQYEWTRKVFHLSEEEGKEIADWTDLGIRLRSLGVEVFNAIFEGVRLRYQGERTLVESSERIERALTPTVAAEHKTGDEPSRTSSRSAKTARHGER